MLAEKQCPDPARYRAFLDGTLSRREMEELANHLEHCSACVNAVGTFAGESLKRLQGRGGASQTRLRRLSKSTHKRRAWFDTPEEGDQDHVPDLIHRILTRFPVVGEPVSVSTIADRDETPPDCPFLLPPQAADEIGRLGAYRVLAKLGAGGMGMVFLAEDPKLRRPVAIKVLKPDFAARPDAGDRFLREARAMAAIQHERIVPVFQVDEVAVEGNRVPYLVMPLLRGESLGQRLKRDRTAEGTEPLPIREALRIGREVAEGLAAAHARGLVHRDIKPDNLWLEVQPDEAGRPVEGGHVKILDFGLARAVEASSIVSNPGALLGTPQYMAPEQAAGEAVDPRADLFSLGCVLYEMATGRRPFTGSSVLTVLQKLANHHPDPPHQINPAVPMPLSDLIVHLLAKDPAGRPGSAREVVEAIQAIEPMLPATLSPAPVSKSPVPKPRLAGKRKVFAWVVGLTAAAALIGWFIVGKWPAGREGSISGTGTPLAQPLDETGGQLPPLAGAIDVFVTEPGNPQRQGLRLKDPGALPLGPKDQFHVLAKLNRPAYLYVLWIDTDGDIHPLCPWQGGKWANRPAVEKPIAYLRRPEALDDEYRLGQRTPGMETLVLLARESPLPAVVDLQALLGRLPQQREQDIRSMVWFEDGLPVFNDPDRRAGFFDVVKANDPVLQTQQRIKELQDQGFFSYSRAVSFANREK